MTPPPTFSSPVAAAEAAEAAAATTASVSSIIESLPNLPSPSPIIHSGQLMAHCVRLEPGADLVPSLLDVAQRIGSPSLCILTAVGSLETVTLRMANASRNNNNDNNEHGNGNGNSTGNNTNEPIKTWNEKLEIISLVGTLGLEGGGGEEVQQRITKHLHMSVADANGIVYGGHLMSGRVYTTLELVLGSVQGVQFTRQLDSRTGYTELTVQSTVAAAAAVAAAASTTTTTTMTDFVPQLQ